MTIVWKGICKDCFAEHKMVCRSANDDWYRTFFTECMNGCGEKIEMTGEPRRRSIDDKTI